MENVNMLHAISAEICFASCVKEVKRVGVISVRGLTAKNVCPRRFVSYTRDVKKWGLCLLWMSSNNNL